MDTGTLFAGLVFGSVGLGYLMYGKKQKRVMALISGLLLGGVPYFIPNIYFLLIAGVILIFLPFIAKF